MEVVANNYVPGDQRLVEKIVYELKSQGIFDQFRKECFADVDTKPAYQNLRQRVEGSVSSFLRDQRWKPDMNKNQVREMLRKTITESGFLETGVERIVDQVVNPKINTVFLPKVEEVVYSYLGVKKPNRGEASKPEQIDLLPNDLEAVSPESEPIDKKDDKSSDTIQDLDGSKTEEDESPPFEPLDEQTYVPQEENSVDSHLSGFSGLVSHESDQSNENKVTPMEQDSQMSRNSSDSRLSIVTSDENSKIDICEDSSKSIKSESNSKQDDKSDKNVDKNKQKSSDRHKSRSESKSEKDKDRRSSKDSKSRHSSSSKDKDKGRDRKDLRNESKSSSSSGSKNEKPKEKSDKDRNKSSSNSRHGGSSSSSKDKNGKKESSSKSDREKDKERNSKEKDKEKDRSRSSSSHSKPKDKSSDSKSKEKSSSSDKHKHSSHSDRHKKDRDRKKDPKSKDDHYSSKDKKIDRRSTDRDSNDGQSSKQGLPKTDMETQSSQSQKTTQDSHQGTGDSGNSDQGETTTKAPVDITEAVGNAEIIIKSPEAQRVKVLKPKCASNIQEALRLIKIRRQLAKLEKHNQLSLADVEVSTPLLLSSSIDIQDIKPNGLKRSKNKKDGKKKEVIKKEKKETKKVKIQQEVNSPLANKVITQDSWDAMEAKLREAVSSEFKEESEESLDDSLEDAPKLTHGDPINDDNIENCKYFDMVDSTKNEFLIFVKEYIKNVQKLKANLAVKLNKKRKIEDTDLKNNNNKKMKVAPEKKKKVAKKNNNTTVVSTNDKFPLPLSPAESDKSVEPKVETPVAPLKPKRNNLLSSQRYSSDDLYKPRPTFASSRRRGAKIAEN